LARAIARELNHRIVIVEHNAINQMSGSTHRIIGLLRPGVLVLNDVDRGSREDNISLLQALEREHQDHPLLTCITVNDIKQLDPAILRPGRVHETREIIEPGDESRRMILDYYVKKFGILLSEEEAKIFVEQSSGFSPADTREFCETALAVGNEIALQEIERIKKQRKLYAGNACQEYNEAKG
jgi:SpoVK/Ycf46/Vps4 family AAA+-type ATPase